MFLAVITAAVELRPAQLTVINTAHVQASATVANGLTGRPGGLAITESALRAGEALIITLRELHRGLPIDLALSAATSKEILAYKDLEELCDQTYSVPFKSGATTPGEELAIVVSEQGVVHVSHAGKKWFKCLHVDPNVQFRVVIDMQTIKKLSVVGITTQLQAPIGQGAGSGDSPLKTDTKKASQSKADCAPPDCVICLENPRDTLLKPCLHFVLCGTCARSLLQASQKECPMCRKQIRDTERIYMN